MIDEPLRPVTVLMGERLYDSRFDVCSVSWSSDSQRLLLAGWGVDVENAPMLQDDSPWTWVVSAEGERLNATREHDLRGAWAPDGTRFVLAPDLRIVADPVVRLAEESGSTALAWSPDGSFIAADHGAALGIWDSHTGRQVTTLGADSAVGVAWSPTGDRIAVGFAPGEVWVWAAGSWDLLQGFECSGSGFHWSPDGAALAVASRDRTRVLRAHLASGELEGVVDAAERPVTSLCWSPDWTRFASTTAADGPRLLALAPGVETPRLESTARGHHLLSWSPDSQRLASICRPSGKYERLCIWTL
jgi:WD40 repeat protein